jgi:hypothetical protein
MDQGIGSSALSQDTQELHVKHITEQNVLSNEIVHIAMQTSDSQVLPTTTNGK